MTTSGVYEIRHKETGHSYIGSSVDITGRKREHFWSLRRGKHHSQYLQRAFDKYGEDAFEVRIVEEVPDRSRLIEREQYWIETRHPRYNMNPAAANRLGTHQSEEAIAKLREYNLRPEVIAKKKAELTGHEVAPETIELIKAARAEQLVTNKMLQALADGRANVTPEQRRRRLGQTNSDEHNRKIAEAHEGMRHLPETIEKMRCAKFGTTQDPDVVAKRIQASWGSKTEEEKAAIIAKRKATIAAKRNQSTETN